MQLILLAAGKGSRLPKKYRKQPKCLAKIADRSILHHNIKFFNYFKNKIIVTGYKSKKLKPFIKKNKFKEIKNSNYKNTNMVYSAFKCYRHVVSDVVVCYSDIIFDHRIYDNLKSHKNIVPLKKNWLKIWKGRMGAKRIKRDAENIVVKKNKIISIGQKIQNKLPKYQYMGIIKLKLKDYKKLYFFYKKLNNKKIDFTSFLDKAIKKNIIKLGTIFTNKDWFEIDNIRDISFTERRLWLYG